MKMAPIKHSPTVTWITSLLLTVSLCMGIMIADSTVSSIARAESRKGSGAPAKLSPDLHGRKSGANQGRVRVILQLKAK